MIISQMGRVSAHSRRGGELGGQGGLFAYPLACEESVSLPEYWCDPTGMFQLMAALLAMLIESSTEQGMSLCPSGSCEGSTMLKIGPCAIATCTVMPTAHRRWFSAPV